MPSPSSLLAKYYADSARKSASEATNEITLSTEVLKAQDDFGYFCWYLTRNQPLEHQLTPAEHHKEWHKHLVTNQDSKCLIKIGGNQKLSILAPRGASKSTVIALFAAWIIGVHTQASKPIQIVYISANKDMAMAKSAAIKLTIESPEYQEIFPMVRKGEKWADGHWSIDRRYANIQTLGQEEFTLIAAGINGTITSKRANLVFFDDLIKSIDDIAATDVREKMLRTVRNTVRPILLEGGRFISIGTRFRPDDIHTTEMISSRGWTVIEQSALVPDEKGELKSYWESMWSTNYLKELKADDEYSFSFQYQNKIMRVEGMSMNPAWIHYGNPSSKFDYFCVGVDLAASERDKACWTVMTLIGKKGDTFWILDYRRTKIVGNIEKADLILDLYENWNNNEEPHPTPWTIYVESVAYQASFQGDWISYVYNTKRMHHLQCLPWRMAGDKLAHLLSVTGVFANGLVQWNQWIDFSYFVSELTDFGSTTYTDCLDSLVITLQGLGVRRKLETAMDQFHADDLKVIRKCG